MKECLYNYDNLIDSDITEIVIRIKVLLITADNIILGYERGIYQFPGGHLELGETFEDCIKREIMEETGIGIVDSQIMEPIYKITYMNKDYPEVGRNRKSEAYYYVIETNSKPDLTRTNYTWHELEGNFRLEEIPLSSVIQKLKDNVVNNKKNEMIASEMIMVIEEYQRIKRVQERKNV